MIDTAEEKKHQWEFSADDGEREVLMERERARERVRWREESNRGRGVRRRVGGGGGRGGDLSFIPVILLDKRRFLIWL